MLKEYIKKVYELEASLYNQNAFCNMLEYKISQLESARDKPRVMRKSTSLWEDSEAMLGCFVIGEFVGIIIGEILVFIFSNEEQAWNKMVIGLGVGAVIGLVIFGLFLLLDASSIDKEEAAVEKQNRKIEIENEQNRKRRQWVVEQFEKELRIVEKSYYETLDILESYYAKGVIYKKYQNFVAVSSFYEYLDSGRCTTLEGHEGAYNIFENELRQNVIIEKLDEVIRYLDRIEGNQSMLYYAIQESNQMVNQMSGELIEVSTKLTGIENNSAVVAYNSRIAAGNTEFIKWLEIYRG